MTQGSSFLATAGLMDGIPLGFSNGTFRKPLFLFTRCGNGWSAPVPGRSNARMHEDLISSRSLRTFHLAVAGDGHTPLTDGAWAVLRPQPRKLSGLIDLQAALPVHALRTGTVRAPGTPRTLFRCQ